MNALAAALATAAATYLLLAAASGWAPSFARRSASRGGAGAQSAFRHAWDGENPRQWLAQADVGLGPVGFSALSLGLGAGVFLVAASMTTAPAVALAPGVTAALVPRAVAARRRERRLRAVTQAWPDALRELIGAVTAGMSLPQALSALATNGPEPLRGTFARFPTLVRMAGVVPALELLRAELGDPTSDRVIEVLIVTHERGGRIALELLRDLAEATTDELRTEEEIATAGLEQRINARTVFVLPWLVLVALTASPGAFRDFYRSPGGLLVVGVAAAASLLGSWLVGRLARDPVEPRVLTAHGGGRS